ncbi:MAG: RAMP superfamily CRISPR-associated protein [Chloroflexota bacterium]|nr:RAMP superfamily CRISPR-associated protein [Chloroflexota bacterium]
MLVQIDFNLNFTAPFHMGTGISTNALDRTVVRDAGEYLYIPASTFKGVLREHCEHLLRFYNAAAGEDGADPHDSNAVLREFGRTPALITRIFGSQLHPGTLRFNDIKQDKHTHETYKNIQTSVLTQVRIDRITGTAADQALYSSEFGNPILNFAGTIKGQLNCTPIDELALLVEEKKEIHVLAPSYSLLLLLAGLLMIERIGGNKSTGKGQCSCTVTEVFLDKHKCSEEGKEDEKGWRFWLEHLAVLSDYEQREKGGQA